MCEITVAVVRTCCMNVVLCMQLWKSKPKLVLRNADSSLTESDASSTLYFQLTEELLNLFYYVDSSSCPCTLCLIILFNWSTVARAKVDLQRGRIIAQIYQSCQINVYNSERTLVSGVGERSNLELFWVSHWCENRPKKPLFGGPIVQWTHTVEVTEAYPLICVLHAE